MPFEHCPLPSHSQPSLPIIPGLSRTAVWEALHGVAKDVEVECTNPEKGGKHVSFKDMLHKMEHTVFCLALAGDSPSTRRLSEIFMAGVALWGCLHGWRDFSMEFSWLVWALEEN